jgi:effector-binding domain-containing protein
MLSAPEIVQTSIQDAAVIHLRVARDEMRNVFGPAVGELMAALRAQGLEASGALFAHHLKAPSAIFDFELGLNVAAPVTASGRVRAGRLPAATVARAVFNGPYEGLPSAWQELNEWVKENGHVGAQNLWEVYRVGPAMTPDSSSWLTELSRPLAG